jgi:hypothetical protein
MWTSVSIEPRTLQSSIILSQADKTDIQMDRKEIIRIIGVQIQKYPYKTTNKPNNPQ